MSSPGQKRKSARKHFKQPAAGVQSRWKEGIKMLKIFKGGHDGCGKVFFAVAFIVFFSSVSAMRAFAMVGK